MNSEILATFVFVTWFFFTVIVQFPISRWKRAREFEPTGHLLPGWHFFSPKPILADIEVLFRHVPTESSRGAPSDWTEVLSYSGRAMSQIVFNPGRRIRKAIFQCCQQLLLVMEEHPEKQNGLPFTIPYLLLLDRVSVLCPKDAAVQFRIDVVRHGAFPVVTAFHSLIHAVDPTVDPV